MSMNCCEELYKGNALLVKFTDLTSESNNVVTVLNTGTVEVNVYDKGTVTPVVTNGGPLTANIVDGYAEVVLPSTLDVDLGAEYDIQGKVIVSAATMATYTITKTAKKRKGGAGC